MGGGITSFYRGNYIIITSFYMDYHTSYPYTLSIVLRTERGLDTHIIIIVKHRSSSNRAI